MYRGRSRRARSQPGRRGSSSRPKTRNPTIRRRQISRRTRGNYRSRPRPTQYVETPAETYDLPPRYDAAIRPPTRYDDSGSELDVSMTEDMMYETPPRYRQQRRYSSDREAAPPPRRRRSRSRSRSRTPTRSAIAERIAQRSPTPGPSRAYNSDSDEEFEEQAEQVRRRTLPGSPHPGNIRYENGRMLDENGNVFNYEALVNARIALQDALDRERARREEDSDYEDSPRRYRRRRY